jgi:hypothetical protein
MGTFILILASAIWGAVHSVLASHGAKDAARHLAKFLAGTVAV